MKNMIVAQIQKIHSDFINNYCQSFVPMFLDVFLNQIVLTPLECEPSFIHPDLKEWVYGNDQICGCCCTRCSETAACGFVLALLVEVVWRESEDLLVWQNDCDKYSRNKKSILNHE